MDEATLIQIIQKLRSLKKEWDTVDAKRELILKEEGDKAEFVKDIIAMANNAKPSYLIIGLEDSTFADVGRLNQRHTTNHINQILAGKIDPPIAIDYKEFSISGIEYATVEIFGKNPPYIAARNLVHGLNDRKHVRISKGVIYVRHQDRTEGISRIELDGILKKRWLFNEFEQESVQAQTLVRNQPDYWEYLLTAELLRSNLSRLRRDIEDLRRGMRYTPTRKMKGKEFIAWIGAKFDDLKLLSHLIGTLITEDIEISWGKPGEPGDALEIKRVADKLIAACEAVVKWETDLHSVTPPQAFLYLRQLVEGWGTPLFDAIETIPTQLDTVFKEEHPSGEHTIKIVFPKLLNVDKYTAELERLMAHRNEWIDEY